MDANLLELLARLKRQRSDRCSYCSQPAIHICSNPKCSAVLCIRCIMRSEEARCPSCQKEFLDAMVARLSKSPAVEPVVAAEEPSHD